MRVSTRLATVVHYEYGGVQSHVEIETTDIGATIGTEFLNPFGARLASYRPGTRHASYAEELAADVVNAALERMSADGIAMTTDAVLATYLRDVLADEQQWDPDAEEEDDRW